MYAKSHKQKNNTLSIEECPECHSTNLEHDYTRAEICCKECGLVIDDEIIIRTTRAQGDAVDEEE